MESNLTKPQESHLKSHSASYAAAGVDVTAGYESVELMKKHVARTAIPGVVSGIGGFGGLFRPELAGMEEPILVSGTDGVGTKLKIAMLLDKHDTIGIDAVAMCVNDIVCCGARPLFFLDYIACGKNYPEKIAEIVSGVAEGCVQAGCALIGGETAEHPGMMPLDDYDIAGFTVGVVDRPKMIDGSRLAPGDVLIGVKSSGVHSNGFSLVRKVFGIGRMEDSGESLVGAAMGLAVSVAKMLKNDTEIVNRHYDELGCTLGEALLTPTRIYVKSALAAIESDIPEHDMFNTFNMGVGLCMAVSPETADKALEALKGSGEDAVLLGEVVSGDEGVLLW